MTKTKIAVFTDVDGTLIDENYSFGDTLSIIQKLSKLDASIILCSSKTRAEIEYYRKKMGINDPFISENGAAVFIPKGYFNKNHGSFKHSDEYDIIELGTPYKEIRKKFESARKKSDIEVIGFGDMTLKEVAYNTGLPLELAKFAQQREYSEPIKIKGDNSEDFFNFTTEEGLHYIKGDRYYHLLGNHDKGKASSILKRIFCMEFKSFESYAVGNGENDLTMLEVADNSFFIRKIQDMKAVWKKILDDILLQK